MLKWLKSLKDRVTSDDYYDEDDNVYDDYDDDYDDDYEEEEPAPPRRAATKNTRQRELVVPRLNAQKRDESPNRNKIIELKGAADVVNRPTADTIFEEPMNADEAFKLTAILKAEKSLIISLEGVPTPEAQRIIDILCGAVKIINGTFTRINTAVVVFSPPSHRMFIGAEDNVTFDKSFLNKKARRA